MLDTYTSHHWIFFSGNMKDITEKTVDWEFLRIKQWATKRGIRIRNTPPYTPEPRGRIERAGGVITTMARTAMIDANLPPSLWPYAEAWAVKILNILLQQLMRTVKHLTQKWLVC
jgi:hypothetical protein